jgi:hypothetical protein
VGSFSKLFALTRAGLINTICQLHPGFKDLMFCGAGNPTLMVGMGNALVANFSGFGLYQHDGATSKLLTGNSKAAALVGVPKSAH